MRGNLLKLMGLKEVKYFFAQQVVNFGNLPSRRQWRQAVAEGLKRSSANL